MILSHKETIQDKLYELGDIYRRSKALILSESDLKCLIYNKLLEIDELAELKRIKEGEYLSNSIHTELSWYDDEGRLAIVPDITLINPRNLSISNNLNYVDLSLPSKQYSFKGNSIIFELKFIKNSSGLTEYEFINKIKEDFKKINKLFRRIEEQDGNTDEVFCYFVIFNRYENKCDEFEQFLVANKEGPQHKIIYVSGEISN